MKVADVVAKFLAEQGIKHVFCVSGGADLHLIHAIAKQEGITYVCPQNEQAASFAADAYARLNGLGCALATSGPGATNLVTGIAASFYDSIPVIYITGNQTIARLGEGLGVRQFGFQATPIVPMVKDVTKYAVTVMKPEEILYELQKAVYTAKWDRPGPVLIDIPDDIQRAEIDPTQLLYFMPDEFPCSMEQWELGETAWGIMDELEQAQRPVLVYGYGVRHARHEADLLARALDIPVVVTWGARDLFPNAIGGFGTHGVRAANFAIQNADYVLCVGTRLDTKATGSPAESFASRAKLVMVDIDPAEVFKMWKIGRPLHRGIVADAGDFLRQMVKISQKLDITYWRNTVAGWQKRYPIILPEYEKEDINPYALVQELSKHLEPEDVIVSDTGCVLGWMMQAYKFKGERFIHALNQTPMGYGLPAAVGAAFATGRRVVLVTGDGGLAVNITELATVARHSLPIKVVLLNNRGHAMCRQTQRQWLGGEYPSTSFDGGLACPNYAAVANAYGIESHETQWGDAAGRMMQQAMMGNGPSFLELNISPLSGIAPQAKFGHKLEDQEPLLPREELEEIMREAV